MVEEEKFKVFFVIWIVLGIASAYLFFFNHNAGFKRKWFPVHLIVTGLLFLGFMVWVGAPWGQVAFVLPPLCLIMFMNYKWTKFCDSCGRTIYKNTFGKIKFCPQCGKELK